MEKYKYPKRDANDPPDKLITRPINEIDVPHPDGRKARAGITVKKVIEFGWEGAD